MKCHLIALMLACGAVASNAHALVYMTDEDGDPIGSNHYSISYVGTDNEGDPIYDVIIKSHHAGTQENSWFVIHGTAGENIGTVTVRAPSDGWCCNYVVIQVVSDDGTDGIKDLYEVDQTTGGTEGAVLNLVKINGSVGPVTIDRIGNIFAGGDIDGPIESTGDHWNPGITGLECNGASGSILGDVTSAGFINRIEALNGDIGTPSDLVTITASYGNIGSVKAQSIYANITAIEGPQYSGYLEHLEATIGQFVGTIIANELRNNEEVSRFSCIGDMVATITLDGNVSDPLIITGGDFHADSVLRCNSLAPHDGRIEITEVPNTNKGGHLYGDMLFGGDISDSDRDIDIDNGLCGLLRIGKNLIGDITIDGTPGQTDEGLTGQVIINAKDNSYAWTGMVTINSIALSPVPYYNNKEVDVGGGAVGLVPYYLHYADSQPSGTKVNQGGDGHENGLGECEEGYHALKKVHPAWSLPKVTLRHYGPILQAGTGKPFTVKRKTIYTLACDAGGNPNWADVTVNFTHSFPANEDRAIEINGSFDPGYDYLIEPKVDENGTDYLYCGGLDPLIDNVPIMDYDYRLRVIVAPDITGNGLLQADDITAWVLDPQDANLDGTTDNNDLVDVINAVAEYGE